MSETIVNLALLILGIGIGLTINSMRAYLLRKFLHKTLNEAMKKIVDYVEDYDANTHRHQD